MLKSGGVAIQKGGLERLRLAQPALAATEGNDPRVLVRVADFYCRAAGSESLVDGERQMRLDRARSLYEKAIQAGSQSVDARLGRARVFLDEKQDLAEGFRSLETARVMRLGCLELDLAFARFKPTMGTDFVARMFTIDSRIRYDFGFTVG
ncbi:MAG: hypothetical protein CL933_06320 [Deltaproteobacteria bacterium]|nr:hypothetical protein [Deltaproteobacteria bacterium]